MKIEDQLYAYQARVLRVVGENGEQTLNKMLIERGFAKDKDHG